MVPRVLRGERLQLGSIMLRGMSLSGSRCKFLQSEPAKDHTEMNFHFLLNQTKFKLQLQFFRLMWHQTKFRLVPIGKVELQSKFNLISKSAKKQTSEGLGIIRDHIKVRPETLRMARRGFRGNWIWSLMIIWTQGGTQLSPYCTGRR